MLRQGVLPVHWFDEYYTREKISASQFNQPVLSNEQANEWLKEKILSGKPFFASRFGKFELGMLSNFLFNQLLGKNFWSKRSMELLATDPSWEGNVNYQERFYHTFLKAVSEMDGIGVWYNYGEQVMANYICKNAVLYDLLAYEPYFYEQPWTLSLRNKKVLIVHPYVHSIPLQYKKREQLFKHAVLPEFELLTYRPFSGYNNEWVNFKDMQATLDKMVTDLNDIDFDIALIACGAQGLPLGAAIKKMNRQAIHVGGALQLFFGILGKRWEEPGRPQQVFFNEHWVRPHASEIPTDARALKFSDAGCYW